MTRRASSILDITLTSPLRVLSPEIQDEAFVAGSSRTLKISLHDRSSTSGTTGGSEIDEPGSPPPPIPQIPTQATPEKEDVKSEAFLSEFASLEEEQKDYPPITQDQVGYHSHGPEDEEFWTRNVMIIRRLRKIVAEDQKLPAEKRIDAVEIGPDPWPEHLLALDGLSPKHFAVYAGFEEEGDVGAIDQLKKPWSELKSLELNNIGGWLQSGDEESDELSGIPYPKFISQIESLTLNYCYGFLFTAKHPPVNVKRLKVIGDDATNTFCAAVENFSGLSSNLETLYLTSNTYQEYDTVLELRQSLVKCTKLRDLTLNLGGEYVVEDRKAVLAEYKAAKQAKEERKASGNEANEDEDPESDDEDDALDHHEDNDTGLCPFIPNSLETLSFHCSLSNTMIQDLDLWIEHSADADWLPNLKRITIRPDGPHLDLQTPHISRLKFEDDPTQLTKFTTKVERVFENLRKRQVPVTAFP
ncbi:hypothetical protein CPB83DRAFT_356376 [Crepidotus variabilis]|uniref:Uncharacterized protein n=1 Tax=Crepidotus variabilis TaxID=179855 RepID=A0A9P6EEL8_9AGAR|nr:hypothetical protein CPB83DRAFT_356376 [Crepidotus variabilis]